MIENAGTANLMIFAVGRQQARRMPAGSGRRRKGSLAEVINGELIVDNFAGGGGASTGIEEATGYCVDIAINHDPEAIKMHKANHPYTKHYCEDVWQVDPVKVCGGHPVALAWFSPDCKHFSKAKGGKPKDKFIRGLAWVACRWAGLVRPRVIMLENVEEFKTWGPLGRRKHPIKAKQGKTFHKFIQQLTDLGYEVQFRELVAADYGAPTMRKRFFLIARCDGKPIAWARRTHGPADSPEVNAGLLKPYVGAYTQLNFSLPCPSIFDSAEEIKEKYGIRAMRPLAKKTMDRIARGIKKFILDNPEPFLIQCNHGGERKPGDIRQPMPTITGKHGFGVVAPSPGHFGEVRAFLTKYYGGGTGQDIKAPLDTITAQDRFGLVTIYGTEYQIVDIGLRMLEPKELYGCQGFPDDYIIDRDCDGKPYPRAEQVRRCGNAVCPPIPMALVRANLKELCVAKRLPNCRADRLGEDAGGQLRFA